MSTNRIRISMFGRKYSNIRIYSNIRFNTAGDGRSDQSSASQLTHNQMEFTASHSIYPSISVIGCCNGSKDTQRSMAFITYTRFTIWLSSIEIRDLFFKKRTFIIALLCFIIFRCDSISRRNP